MSNKIGLCVVGCGNYAAVVSDAIQPLLSEVDLYFASRDIIKARDYQRRFNGTDVFGSYSEAVLNPEVQAVYICTPHHLHLEHAKLCASSGKDILIEKPLANTTKSAREIITLAKESGINLMVAENYRFMPAIRMCKQLMDEGAIGQIRIVQVQEEFAGLPTDWRKIRESNGGGVFIDGGIHKVHFLRYLLGNPEKIYASSPASHNPSHEGEDGLILVCHWKTGEIGLINHSWVGSQRSSTHWISISGTLGRVYLEIGETSVVLEQSYSTKSIPICQPFDGILPMMQEFISSIRENRAPEITGYEGLQDLQLVEYAYQSLVTKSVYTVEPNIVQFEPLNEN